nr:hypothetical protein [Tanacetum cinerariifolium]
MKGAAKVMSAMNKTIKCVEQCTASREMTVLKQEEEDGDLPRGLIRRMMPKSTVVCRRRKVPGAVKCNVRPTLGSLALCIA